MAFAPRSRSEIRASLLSTWSSRYAAAGLALDTSEGSDAYMFADALALELEALEAQALALTKEILPDTATAAFLDRHGAVEGLERNAAVAASHTVTITGTAGAGVSFLTQTLQSSAGLTYVPTTTSATLDGAGHATITVTCRTAGPEGTLATGAILTWSSTPANLHPTATVASTVTTGAAEEDDDSYAERILELRKERPASGNRADWRDWVEAYTGVVDAYVYPLLAPPTSYPGAGTPDTPGCVTVVAVGPAQGDSPVNTRIVGGGSGGESLAASIGAYIEGTLDADGVAVPAAKQVQRRPVTMRSGDYSIEAANVVSQDIDLRVTTDSSHAFPWSGTMTVDVSSTTTSLVVSGNHASKAGTEVLVNVGPVNVRGGYQLVRLLSGSYNGGTGLTTFTLSTTLAGTPGGVVYPAPPNYRSLRDAVFALFDSLGPGDTIPASRWPTEATKGRATLYPSALVAAVLAVTGVLDVTVVTPAAPVTPAAKTIVSLGRLVIRA